MKNIIVLEINSKKDTLGTFEINTPSEYLLVNTIEPILNNRIFDEFIDEIFFLITEEIAHEFDEKINNVYVTFLNNDDEFVCSVVLDKLKPKKGTYRRKVIDWKASGYTFKYLDEETNNGLQL